MERILVVEDNHEYVEFIQKLLVTNNYDVDVAVTAVDGLELLALNKYDLLISDLHLEDINGIRLITSAKRIDENIKTIILTAEPSLDTELEAMNCNADLYLEKSKSIDLLLFYIKKILSEISPVDNDGADKYYSESEGIVLDVKSHKVTKDGDLIQLSPKEFEILKLMLMNKTAVLTRDQIVESVWKHENLTETSRTVDVHIQKIREKLNIFSILTVRGAGYKWNE